MNNCIICRKIIYGDNELCDEHRSIIKSISDNYNQDAEMHRRWDNIVELVKSKSHTTNNNDIIDEVLDFIDELKSESGKK